MAKHPGIRCDQAIRPLGVENCCVTDFEPCFKPATHQHTQTTVALCAKHWENAFTMGGPEAGQWPVGMRILPFPEGWVELPPQEEEEPHPATPAALWVEPTRTVGGLVIDV